MNPVPKNRTHHNTSHLSYFYNALCCRCAWQWRSSLAVMPGTSRTTTTYVWTIMASSWRSQIICNAKRWYNGIVRIFRPSATPHAHWPTRPTINWTICWSIPSTSSSTVMCQKWHAPIGSEYWCWWPISGRMARTHWRYLHQWRIHRACESYTFYCIHHMHRNNNCYFAFSAGSKNSARCPRRSETKFYPNTPNSWSFAIHSNDSFLRIETNWRVICPALGIFKHALANRLSNRSVQTRPPNHWIGVTTLHLTNLSCTYWRPNWAWIIRQISRSTSIGSQSTNCAIRATSNTMLLVSFYAQLLRIFRFVPERLILMTFISISNTQANMKRCSTIRLWHCIWPVLIISHSPPPSEHPAPATDCVHILAKCQSALQKIYTDCMKMILDYSVTVWRMY